MDQSMKRCCGGLSQRANGIAWMIGAAVGLVFAHAQCALATDKGWAAQVVTGAITTKQVPAPKASNLPIPVERVYTAAVPSDKKAIDPIPAKASSERQRGAAPAGDLRPAQQYCINIANAAADARITWQKKMLGDMERELEDRIAKLEAKLVEYQQWLARRDEYSKKAQEQLVGIFARMRPDAAAAQLAVADEETSAAILSKLDTRVSSTILAEMEPNQAARLTAIMVGAGKVTSGKSARAGRDGKRS
jgi:flagellar motility protein MotE (MotC chaperone)